MKLSVLIGRLCWKLVSMLPTRTKLVEIDGTPYLLRFYIKKNGRFPGIYLHHFFTGDSDRDLHDHPWSLSVSLILTGGYREERLVPETDKQSSYITQRVLRPGSINIIRGNDFHRVDLLEDGAWTLFISGKKTKGWGFFKKDEGTIVSHIDYLTEKGRLVEADYD